MFVHTFLGFELSTIFLEGPIVLFLVPAEVAKDVACAILFVGLINELHDWVNIGRGMCCPVCGMVHIKEPLLLIGKSSPCSDGIWFSLSL